MRMVSEYKNIYIYIYVIDVSFNLVTVLLPRNAINLRNQHAGMQ